MRRIVAMTAAILLLCGVLVPEEVVVAGETPSYNGESGDVNREFPANEDGKSYQITYGGIAAKQYVLLILDSGTSEVPTAFPQQPPAINTQTITYMDQAKAHGTTGEVSFQDFIPKTSFTYQYVYITGANGTGLTGLKYLGYLEKLGPVNVSDKISFSSGSAVYSGAGQRYETATIADISGGTWTYTYQKKSTAGFFDDEELPQGAGTYTVKATYEGMNHWGSKEVEFTIEKATPTLEFGKLTQIQNSQGTGIEPITVKLFPSSQGAMPLVEYYAPVASPEEATWSSTPPAAIGEYPVRATFEGDDNLNAISGSAIFKIQAYKKPEVELGGGGGGGGGGGSSDDEKKEEPQAETTGGAISGSAIEGTDALRLNEETKFTDVAEDAWYKECIYELQGRGIVSGMTEHTFAPENNVTRAQFVAILANLAEADLTKYSEISFQDVGQGDWYRAALEWARQTGVAVGFGGLFRPNENITRQDIAVMMAQHIKNVLQYEGKMSFKGGEDYKFADDNQIRPYAREAVILLRQNGVVSGRGNNEFAPLENATRAEACAMIYNLLNLLEQEETKESGGE